MTKDDNHRYIVIVADDQQCIFDFQSTGNEDVAKDTAKVNTKVEKETEILGKIWLTLCRTAHSVRVKFIFCGN